MARFARILSRLPDMIMLSAIVFAQILFPLAVTRPAYAANNNQNPTDHCPSHDGNPNKIESTTGSQTVNGVNIIWSGDPGQVVFTNTNLTSATITWCAKGGTDFWDDDKSTGEQSDTLEPGIPVAVSFGTAVSYFIVYKVEVEEPEPEPEPEPETGGIQVNKMVDEGEGFSSVGAESPFKWGLDDGPVNRDMGTTQEDLAAGAHTVEENEVIGYDFVGWFIGQGSCDEPEGSTAIVPVAVVENETSVVTFCNEAEPEEPTEQKVVICHSTQPNPSQGGGSGPQNNPYVKLSVSVSAADGIAGNENGQGDHFAEHNGPLFIPGANQDYWGDIIPPIEGIHDGLNWPEGQAIYEADCEVPEPPEGQSLTVIKDTQPDHAQNFGFEITDGDEFDESFTLDDDGDNDNARKNSQVFDDIEAGIYAITEDEVKGWLLSNISCNAPFERDGNTVLVLVAPFADVECTFVNQEEVEEEPDVQLLITKSNDKDAPTTVGDFVIYTLQITVPQESGTSFNTCVTDLPPENFNFTGEWTASSSNLGHDVAADVAAASAACGSPGGPDYQSPGQWFLGTLLPGEIVTLTYQTLINGSVSPGDYPDLAFVTGFSSLLGEGDPDVLGNVSAGASTPFVGTLVSVVSPVDSSANFSGQVLGLTTLPRTGLGWLNGILLPILVGTGYFILEKRRGRKKAGA